MRRDVNVDSDHMRIGVLTGGGDCPGLNAVIRAVARRSWARGHEVVGVREGWKGMVEQVFQPLGPREISGILPRGGTIIGTSRTNPYKVDGGVDGVRKSFEELDALVAIGGEDTLGVAARVYAEFEAPVVGVPKTIDNDLSGTDYTFGFDTAVSICTEAIDRLHTTAESHNRVMVVEVMGRHTGWIAVHSGIAGGADVILIPERPVDFDEVTNELKRRHASGKNFSIVVVSEGCELPGAEDKGEVDQFGHKLLAKRGVGDRLGEEIETRTGFETRVTVLGHVQRGGSPTAYDRDPRHTVRAEGRGPRRGRRVRADGVASGRRRRRGVAQGGDGRAEDRAGRLVRRRPRVLRLRPRARPAGTCGAAAAARRSSGGAWWTGPS